MPLVKKKNNVLVIAAHPDDEILGCGGTLAKLKKNGFEIHIFFLSDGITARYEKKDFNSIKVQKEIKNRNLQAVNALKKIGVKKNNISFGTRDCCRLDQVPLIDLVKDIEKELDVVKPKIIFTNWHNDLNIDHKITNNALRVAVRPVNKNYIEEILSFEVLSSTEWNSLDSFNPNYFVDISNFIDLKCKSFNQYKDEIRKKPHPRTIENIKALAKYRGGQSGFNYAEAFFLIKKYIK